LTALVFLVASLACTPFARRSTGRGPSGCGGCWASSRSSTAALHAATYSLLDQRWEPARDLADVTKRPFIIAGFAAFLILIPLAATSTASAVRRLGFPRWKRLHRLVYLAGILAAIHFVLRVKKDVREPASTRRSSASCSSRGSRCTSGGERARPAGPHPV
jgi:sulfoxide reductase heme-binding subunit YedZ